MSTGNVIKCACCGADVEEGKTVIDADLALEENLRGPVCVAFCKGALQWAHAHLRRRTAQGVSITGIHGPREKPIHWDPSISQRELERLDEDSK